MSVDRARRLWKKAQLTRESLAIDVAGSIRFRRVVDVFFPARQRARRAPTADLH